MRTVIGALALAQAFMASAPAQDPNWNSALQSGERAEQAGQYPAALVCFRQAVKLAGAFGTRDPRTWTSYNRLAIAYDEAGLPNESIRAYRHAMSLVKNAIGASNANYSLLQANLSGVYLGMGDLATANDLLRGALAIETNLPHPNALRIAIVQCGLAETELGLHRYRQAERTIQAALPALENSKGTMQLALALNNLAVVRRYQHRYAESIDLLQRSLVILEKEFGPSHPMLLRTLDNMAVDYMLLGRMDEAGAVFQRARTIAETLPPDHPSRAILLSNYAAFLRRTGEKKEAKVVEHQAETIGRDAARRDGAGLTVDTSAFRQH